MFDQIKDLYKLKKQAEELQKQMGGERITATYGAVSVTINGNQELVDVSATGSDLVAPQALADDFRKAFNQAQSEMKKVIAQKFRGMM
jgi:DNA-binding protein YbaB